MASFSGTPTSGPAPLTVSFSDLTTGAASSWSWDFGDMTASSSQNPTHTYSTAGTYTVSLTVAGPGGIDTETLLDYVTVIEATAADFSAAPTSGVAPLTVSFTDLTTADPTSWNWNFGDGSSSTDQDPTHTYTNSGTYTVSLTANGPGGADTETRASYIVASEPAPVADFDASPTSGTAPLDVTFTDLSSGVVTAWAWDFGDGSFSSAQNPAHTYAAAGTYTVALTAGGPGGSVIEIKADYITVGFGAPVADFSGSPTSGQGTLSVSFTNTSSGNVTGFSWNFGDGGSSSLQNPAHTYSPGTYTVSLTVSGPGGNDTETKTDYITVSPPAVADFTATPLIGSAPLTVSFTDATTPAATSWSWNFGDTGASTLQNPTHTYTAPGTYTVTLVAEGAAGVATEEKSDFIVVQTPATSTYYNGTGVNPPCFAATPPVIGSTWTGTVDSSILPSPVVTIIFGRFAKAGPISTIYGQLLVNPSAFLFDSVRVASGGVDTHTFVLPNDPSLVGRPAEAQAMVYANSSMARFCNAATMVAGYAAPPLPAANFTATPASGAAPLSVSFNDTSTGPVTSWRWNFGDGSGSSAPNPSHVYSSPGTYPVSLVVEGPNGYDSEVRVGFITVTSGIVAGPEGSNPSPTGNTPAAQPPTASGTRATPGAPAGPDRRGSGADEPDEAEEPEAAAGARR